MTFYCLCDRDLTSSVIIVNKIRLHGVECITTDSRSFSLRVNVQLSRLYLPLSCAIMRVLGGGGDERVRLFLVPAGAVLEKRLPRLHTANRSGKT